MATPSTKFLCTLCLVSAFAVVSNAETGSMTSHHSKSSCVTEPSASSSPSAMSSSTALASSINTAEPNLNFASSSFNKNKKSKKRKEDPFSGIYQMVKMDNYGSAQSALEGLQTPHRQADKFNLMGLVAQKTGDLTSALKHYQRALSINPRHVQALNHQAELFLLKGNLDKAKENLNKIDEICWLGCNEKTDLKNAIEIATKQ